MQFKTKLTMIYECSLERAFKTPILCDVSKVHTGYGLMPKVTNCTEDQDWGKVGSSKKIFVEKSLTHSGGFASIDKIKERIENKYWKIEISDFQAWMIGFNRFEGEWGTTELEPNKIFVEYTYTLHSNSPIFYPLNWIFVNTFWRKYMKLVLNNVKKLAYEKEPYIFE